LIPLLTLLFSFIKLAFHGWIKALFGLTYFRAYAKQLIQINMSSSIIYKLVNVVYEKTVYEGTIFVSENL